MKYLITLLGIVVGLTAQAQSGLIVNEFSQGNTGNREFIELVVVGTRTCTDSVVDLRNWIVDDQNGWYGGNSTGIASGHIRFQNISNWQNVPIGSIILLYNATTATDKNLRITLADDPTDANGDKVYVVPVGSTTTYLEGHATSPTSPSSVLFSYPSGTTGYSTANVNWGNRLGLANGGDAVITVSPSSLGAPFHSVTYDLVIGSSYLTPIASVLNVGGGRFAYLTGSTYTGSSAFTSDTVGVLETPGAPNTTANATWIASLKTINITTASATGTNPVACSGNGSITITGLCASKTYTVNYSFNGTAQTSTTLTSNASGTATWTNRPVGTYSNIVLTATGITVNTLGPVSLVAPGAPSITAAATQPSGCNTNDASILISGLTPGTSYTYNYVQNGTLNITNITTSSPTGTINLVPLAAGTYSGITVTATSSGCISNTAGPFTLVNGQLSSGTTTVIQPTQCSPANGSIAVNGLPTAAPAAYTYLFNGNSVSGTGNISSAGTLTINSLAPGTYTNLQITATGCSTANLGPFTLSAPSAPSLGTATGTNPSTCGTSTGSIAFTGLLPSAIYTYQYYVGSTLNTGTATTNGTGGLTISGLPAGSYTNISVLYQGCSSNAIAGPVTLTNPAAATPVTTIINPTTCGGSNGTITVSGLIANTSYTVLGTATNGSTTSSVSTTITSNASGVASFGNFSAGTTVLFTVDNGCTSPTVSAGPFANPTLPTVIVSSNGPIVCQGSTLTINASSSTGTSYNWTGPSGYTGTGATQTLTNIQTSAAGTYSVTVTNTTTACTSTPANVTISVTATPAAPAISSNSPVCIGGTLNLSTTATATAYSWTGPGGYTASTQNPSLLNVTSSAAGTYSLIATINGCPSATATTTVAVTPLPVITNAVGTNPTTCGGSNGSILLTGLPASSTISLSYTQNSTAQTATGTTTASGTFTVSGLSAGTYAQFTATVAGCTSAAYAGPVTLVNPSAPSAPTASSNSPICAGAILSLSATTITGATYSWTGPNGFSATTQNPTLAAATTAATGTYSVTATVSGCTSTAGTTAVTVNPIPATPTAGGSTPVCSGATLSLTATTVTGATYTWTGPNGFSSTTQNPSISNVTTAATGTYSVTATIAGCTSSASTKAIVVQASPAITGVTGTNPTTCNGSNGSLVLTGLPASTTVSITYTLNSVAQTATGTTNGSGSVTISGLAAGTYAQFAASSAGCTSATYAGPVTLNTPLTPITPAPSSNGPICAGNTLNLSANIVTGASNWTGPNGFTSTVPNPSIAGATTLASGTYFVTSTINGCTSAAGTVTVVVNPVPASPVASSNSPICSGNTLNLFATLVPSATYSWTGPGGFTSAAQNPTITAASTTAFSTYSVTATVAGCTSPAATTVVTVNPSPAITSIVGTNPATCGGAGSIAINGLLAGTTYTVSYSKNGVAQTPLSLTANTGGQLVLTNLSPGTYGNFTVAGAAGCTATSTTVVTLVQPVVTLTPVITGNTTMCQGGSLTLTATVSGMPGAVYSWTGPSGFTANTQTISLANVQPASSGTYSVTGTVATCTTVPGSVSVVINAIPAAPAPTGTNTYCQFQPAAPLTATGSNLLWYTASTGGTGTATAPIPATTTAATTTWYVSQTVNGCESNRTPITITVISKPAVPTATTSYTYCLNATTTTLTATGTALLWYTVPTGGTGSSTAPTPSSATAGTTTWYVSQTVNGCESDRAAITVTIISSITAPTVTTPINLCQNPGTVSLAPYVTGSGQLWYTAASGGTGSATPLTVNTATTGTTTYYVSRAAGGCESPRVAVAATVVPTPLAPTTIAVVYCQGAPTVPLQATGTGILWYTTATSGVGQSTITPSSAAAGQFSFYATQTVNGCESPRKQTIVTINATPAPPTTNNPSWCEYGAPVSITANGQNILWYTTATGGTGSTVPPVAPGTGSGTYTYYVTQTVGGCESPRAIATITVKPKPAPPFIAGPFIFCQYAPSSPLTAQGQNLLWYSTPAGAGSSTTAPTPSTSYAGIQQYYVSQTVAGCESDRALVTVDIREKPNATFTYSRPWVCAGDTLQFNYYGNGLPSWDYRWKAPLGAVILSGDSTQGPVIIRFNEAGTKTVSLVVQNGGCPSDRMSLSIDVRPLPVVAMNLPAHGCVDEDITVSLDSASRNIKSFVWTFDGATVKSGTQTGGPYELTWNTPGIKVLTATGTANGCPNIPDGDTIEIHDHPKPRIRFNKPDRICAGDSVLLMAEQTAGSHYAWTPAINFINTSEAATVWASVSRTRYLTLQETDQWGCAGTDSVLIEAQPCCDVFVPTAFTPNGDGLNDDFGIASPGNFIISAFRVYNRWGQTVWESANSHGKWNGTQGGSPAPMGTYFYRIKYKCMSGEEFEKQGDLTLIR